MCHQTMCILDHVTRTEGGANMAIGKITVVNKHHKLLLPNKIYIGRGSPLGNPFPIKEGFSTREQVIEKYEDHFRGLIASNNKDAIQALDHMESIVRGGENLYLECFCAPKACHGDIIKKYLEVQIREG